MSKELRETRIWLLIIVRAGLIKPASKLDVLIGENNQFISIFVTSIGTAKQNKNKTSQFDIPCSTFDIKSVCSMAKNIIINDATFLYCTRLFPSRLYIPHYLLEVVISHFD